MKTVLIFISVLYALSLPAEALAREKLDWFRCDLSKIKFDDGDSFSCGEEQIRVLGIDTPETKHPEHGITKDQELGRKAAEFTEKLLKNAKRITIARGGKDGYGRTLAHVILDGELMGVKLIKAGLAYENVSRYGDNGLPEFALEIGEAARVAPKPEFEDPHTWRKKHQKKK